MALGERTPRRIFCIDTAQDRSLNRPADVDQNFALSLCLGTQSYGCFTAMLSTLGRGFVDAYRWARVSSNCRGDGLCYLARDAVGRFQSKNLLANLVDTGERQRILCLILSEPQQALRMPVIDERAGEIHRCLGGLGDRLVALTTR